MQAHQAAKRTYARRQLVAPRYIFYYFIFLIFLILTSKMHVQVFLTATTVWYLSSYSVLEVATQPARMGVIITTGRVVQW